MIITINTNQDSEKDIKRAIKLLQEYCEEANKETITNKEITKFEESKVQIIQEEKEKTIDFKNNNEIPETKEQNNQINKNEHTEINHINLMSQSKNNFDGLPPSMKANPGTPPDFSSYLELIKKKQSEEENNKEIDNNANRENNSSKEWNGY